MEYIIDVHTPQINDSIIYGSPDSYNFGIDTFITSGMFSIIKVEVSEDSIITTIGKKVK